MSADPVVEGARGGDVTGEALIAAMQASPCRDVDITPKREPMPVRDIEPLFTIEEKS